MQRRLASLFPTTKLWIHGVVIMAFQVTGKASAGFTLRALPRLKTYTTSWGAACADAGTVVRVWVYVIAGA